MHYTLHLLYKPHHAHKFNRNKSNRKFCSCCTEGSYTLQMEMCVKRLLLRLHHCNYAAMECRGRESTVRLLWNAMSSSISANRIDSQFIRKCQQTLTIYYFECHCRSNYKLQSYLFFQHKFCNTFYTKNHYNLKGNWENICLGVKVVSTLSTIL